MTNRKKYFDAILLITLCSILVIFSSYPAFFIEKNGFIEKQSLSFLFLSAISSLLAMFLAPLLVIKYVYKKSWVDYGLKYIKIDWNTVKLTFYYLLPFLPIVYFFSQNSSFQEYYLSSGTFLKENFFIFTLLSLVYYISEEFLFRGFLLFRIKELFNENTGIYINSTLFALFHTGKPSIELFFAFLLGIALSKLTIKTGSIFPGVAIHFILAFLLNLFVILA